MKIDILIPHYRTGKLTAYSIAQLLKYSEGHELNIIVINNSAGDGSDRFFEPFKKGITLINYPEDRLQSHAIAFNFALQLGLVQNDYFVTIESDSFPTKNGWLDYYQRFINGGYDIVGSKLKLSGGEYLHPCFALYSKKLWEEAEEYCQRKGYIYFPNAAMKDTFASHLMVHESIVHEFMRAADEYVEPSPEYQNKLAPEIWAKAMRYSPTVGAFHNGMGMSDESLYTYGQRTIESESGKILYNTNSKKKIIYRVGMEPGQWLTYYSVAMHKKIFYVPTETVWMEGRENQQQAMTVNEAGCCHLWGGTAFSKENGMTVDEDIKKAKQDKIEELYNSLPEHQKIKQ